MTDHRLLATWLRPLAGLFALAAAVFLSGCGGGSGAPNNPYAPTPAGPGPLTVLPVAATVYSGVPATLTISGGFPPYRAFSSDSSILPVAQSVAGATVLLVGSNVPSDTGVTITVQDSAATVVTSAVTVKAAPLLPNLITVTPNPDCTGTNNLCSGGSGTATVVVTAPGGGGVPGRQVRFDVVSGSFAIQTFNPAQPLASTLTVVTDQNGTAIANLSINVNAVTQIATIRATDVTSGNQVTGNFTIQQITDGSAILSVVPTGNTLINGPTATTCSSGVSVAYYIFGGTPPYTVQPTFPQVVAMGGTPVLTNGGGFTATTNGACFVNMQFAITDASGRTIPGGDSPTLTNALGTAAAVAAPALTVAPATIPAVGCMGKTFDFVAVGGTAPYSALVSPSPPAAFTGNGTIATPFAVTFSAPFVGTATLTVTDSSVPQKATSATVVCT
jgi:hypothetical protein